MMVIALCALSLAVIVLSLQLRRAREREERLRAQVERQLYETQLVRAQAALEAYSRTLTERTTERESAAPHK
jgi:hypothetical protein